VCVSITRFVSDSGASCSHQYTTIVRCCREMMRCPLVAVVLSAFFAVHMCRTSARPVDLEQAVREWLYNFNPIAEQVMFDFISAHWNFNTNLTRENNQRVVCNTVDECTCDLCIFAFLSSLKLFMFFCLQPSCSSATKATLID